MIVEIVTTGTELLLGQIINTNNAYLSKQFNQLGFSVLYQTTVGDNKERMAQILNSALSRADIVVTSGGLGPTQGDITKEVVAEVIGRKLIVNEKAVNTIKCFFAERHINMPESNIRQAMLPEGSIALYNERGTAPGVIVENEHGKIIINLPGPPYELEWMFERSVKPYLVQRFGTQGSIISKVLHTFGLGESLVEDKIKDIIKQQTNPTIALLARPGEIIVRITAKANSETEAYQLIKGMEEQIVSRLEDHIFGTDNDTMEAVIAQILINKKLTIALAESCTGGLVTSRITDIPGSSDYLIGSLVCYSNQVKLQELDISSEVLSDYGAVSEQTAQLMAAGIRRKFNTSIGLGITGIAGPGGGSEYKPVGLVYIAIDGPNGLECKKYNFAGRRDEIKFRSSQAALDLLRRYATKV